MRLGEAVAERSRCGRRAPSRACSRGCRGCTAPRPTRTMFIASRSTAGEAGPRSTRSPRKIAWRPSGCVASSPSCVTCQPSESSSSTSSVWQPWTSPMRSNGPVSRACRSTAARGRPSARSISSTPRSTNTLRKPSRARLVIERRSADRWLRITWSPKSRSGRLRCARGTPRAARRARSAQAKTWWSLASAMSGLRSSGRTLVASITAMRPDCRRFAAMVCSTSNAASVAD